MLVRIMVAIAAFVLLFSPSERPRVGRRGYCRTPGCRWRHSAPHADCEVSGAWDIYDEVASGPAD